MIREQFRILLDKKASLYERVYAAYQFNTFPQHEKIRQEVLFLLGKEFKQIHGLEEAVGYTRKKGERVNQYHYFPLQKKLINAYVEHHHWLKNIVEEKRTLESVLKKPYSLKQTWSSQYKQKIQEKSRVVEQLSVQSVNTTFSPFRVATYVCTPWIINTQFFSMADNIVEEFVGSVISIGTTIVLDKAIQWYKKKMRTTTLERYISNTERKELFARAHYLDGLLTACYGKSVNESD